MSKVDQRLATFRAAGRKALIPFITAGDPDLETTVELIRAFDRLGCGVCEIGIPYSDPIADGPVIQASYTRSLERGIRVEAIFDAIGSVAREIEMPVVVMVSYAIVHRIGIDSFLDRAIKAGIAGAIVPDLLIEDGDELQAAASAKDFSLIRLVTPTTPADRAAAIARASTGFVYCVSVTGITGERATIPAATLARIEELRRQTSVPICVGFGISAADQVADVGRTADGVIVGSALVRRLAEPGTRAETVERVARFAGELVAGLESVALGR